MNRIAVYTCIIGGYDELRQPLATDGDFDFICFVGPGEKSNDRIGAWEIRELPERALSDARAAAPAASQRARYLSRWPKMHPHLLFPEYAASVWVDGNILIADGSLFSAVRARMEAGSLFSAMEHPSRDCVYDEAVKCRDMRYFGYFTLFRILAFYCFHGIRRHEGLLENNVIFRVHGAGKVVEADELWWSVLPRLGGRDQLSLVWCLRKAGLPQDRLLPEGFSTRNHPGFKYLSHK